MPLGILDWSLETGVNHGVVLNVLSGALFDWGSQMTQRMMRTKMAVGAIAGAFALAALGAGPANAAPATTSTSTPTSAGIEIPVTGGLFGAVQATSSVAEKRALLEEGGFVESSPGLYTNTVDGFTAELPGHGAAAAQGDGGARLEGDLGGRGSRPLGHSEPVEGRGDRSGADRNLRMQRYHGVVGVRRMWRRRDLRSCIHQLAEPPGELLHRLRWVPRNWLPGTARTGKLLTHLGEQ